MARKRKVKIAIGKGRKAKVIKTKIPDKFWIEAIEIGLERFLNLQAKGGKQ